MENYLLDWANFLLRWLHIITAIAWIGSSFYFVFLDSSLVKPNSKELQELGVGGELWAVHGGGFYNPQKYTVAPKKLPEHLHWFYWESYSTWLSGFSLFTLLYLWQANSYLIDTSIMNWDSRYAIMAALAFLIFFWIIYDSICRLFGSQKNGDLIIGILLLLIICVACYAASHLFSGRATFLLIGAMLATSMSANVFFWIIPGQKKTVKALKLGLPVDPTYGIRAKQRSVHNTYFTLPVLFSMISNHYSFLYSHPQRWLVLIMLMVAGAAIRQFFVLRHRYKLGLIKNPWPYALMGILIILSMVVWLKPNTSLPTTNLSNSTTLVPLKYSDVQSIFENRCYTCHGETTQMKGINLTTENNIIKNISTIYQQVVITKNMPLNNITQITDEERKKIQLWLEPLMTH